VLVGDPGANERPRIAVLEGVNRESCSASPPSLPTDCISSVPADRRPRTGSVTNERMRVRRRSGRVRRTAQELLPSGESGEGLQATPPMYRVLLPSLSTCMTNICTLRLFFGVYTSVSSSPVSRHLSSMAIRR